MDGSFENQNVKTTKRQWTLEEDALLVQGLLKLVDKGWKADADSFKPGYTKVLERYIHDKFPSCTLKANTHIDRSRVKPLKTQYSAIRDMLGPSASGFGWDDTRRMIVLEKEIYSEWCKSHPTAIGLYGKPFPQFNALDIAFGKDNASGNMAEDTVDMSAQMEKEYFSSTQRGESEINLNENEKNFETQVPETPSSNNTTQKNPTIQSQRETTSYRTGKLGEKNVNYNDDVASDSLLNSLNKLREFYASNVENMQQLSSCFLHEKYTAERRSHIVSILKEIEGLTAADVVRAAMVITKDNNLCDCFFSMDTPELKKEFVRIVLSNN